MRRFLRRLTLRLLLADYTIDERSMPEEEMRGALLRFIGDKELQKLINITIANLIRRHLYIKSMEDKNWYSGQITSLLSLQERAKELLTGPSKRVENKEPLTDEQK